MQLKTKDGIACDYCGATHTTDFSYYSFDFRHSYSVGNRRQAIDSILATDIISSLDICGLCFDTVRKKVVAHNKTRSNKFICDWSGIALSGDFEYYYCVVSKIIVTMSNQPSLCVGCGAASSDKSPCKCGGNEFAKQASLVIDDRHLELVICVEGYNHFVDKFASVRKIAGEWSTKG